jgi:GH15 family glucan-1,4-alpha-glucosidase
VTDLSVPPTTQAAVPVAGDYAFLSDREVMALVAPNGSVEWLCLPRLDSPSVFGAILDRAAGVFRLATEGALAPATRRHLPGTRVLETSWVGPTGSAIVRDVLLIGPRPHSDGDGISHAAHGAPADHGPDRVLLRTARCVTGTVPIALECAPGFNYGRRPARWAPEGAGTHEAVATADGTDLRLRLTTDMDLDVDGTRVVARADLGVGEARYCALSWGDGVPPRTYGEANWRLVWAAHHWQQWTSWRRRAGADPGLDERSSSPT